MPFLALIPWRRPCWREGLRRMRSWRRRGLWRDQRPAGEGATIAPALELKARALIKLGQPAEALLLLDEALTLATDMNYRRILWRVQRTRGDAYSALGNADAAAGSYKEAAAILRALADTIPDAQLQNGFLSNPVVVSTFRAAQSEDKKGGQR